MNMVAVVIGALLGVVVLVSIAVVAKTMLRTRRLIAEAMEEPPDVPMPDVAMMLNNGSALEVARAHVALVGYRQGRPPMSRSDPGIAPELFIIRKDGGSQTLRDRGSDVELRRLGEDLAERLGVEFHDIL